MLVKAFNDYKEHKSKDLFKERLGTTNLIILYYGMLHKNYIFLGNYIPRSFLIEDYNELCKFVKEIIVKDKIPV